MKRIERNTYNSLRKSITADTLNVEIPVEYTHEGRQGIHEMLTVEKHMRASMICWNSITNGYVIHYVPTVDEYTEAQAIRRAEIAEKYGFIDIQHRLYRRTRVFTTAEYVQLLGTYSDHIALPDEVRLPFFREVEAAINTHGGTITIYDTIDLQLARKP